MAKYRLGIGLLLFGILLANIPIEAIMFIGAAFGLMGLFFVLGACEKEANEKENETSVENSELSPAEKEEK